MFSLWIAEGHVTTVVTLLMFAVWHVKASARRSWSVWNKKVPRQRGSLCSRSPWDASACFHQGSFWRWLGPVSPRKLLLLLSAGMHSTSSWEQRWGQFCSPVWEGEEWQSTRPTSLQHESMSRARSIWSFPFAGEAKEQLFELFGIKMWQIISFVLTLRSQRTACLLSSVRW